MVSTRSAADDADADFSFLLANTSSPSDSLRFRLDEEDLVAELSIAVVVAEKIMFLLIVEKSIK